MKAYKKYDVVTDKYGSVGLITEQSPAHLEEPTYVVDWIRGSTTKVAWFHNHELVVHFNMFDRWEDVKSQKSNSIEHATKMITVEPLNSEYWDDN